MTVQPPEGDFPQVHPSGGDQTVFTRPDWLLRLPNFLVQLIEKIVGLVVQAITGIFLPGPIGSAFSQLTNWATTLLPAQILEPFQDLVDALISLLGHIPIVGPIISQLADIFGFLNDNTTTAQGSANTANSEIAALKAAIDAGTSGALITDSFDRAAASNLGANWTQTYESGSGTWGTDGAGNTHWTAAGSGSRYCTAVYNATTLTTDVQKAQVVLNTAVSNFFIDPEVWLCLRMDSTGDNYVTGLVHAGDCEIGYVTSGTYHRIGSAVSQTSLAGDLWEFRAGTTTSNYEFVLMQNGVTKVTRTDSTPSSLLGASYRYSGLTVRAGAQTIGFATQQKSPPDIGVFTATDYTP